MSRSFYPAAATLAAAILLTASSSLSLADTAGFVPLIQKKGLEAYEVVEAPTLYRETMLPGLPCSAEGFEFFLDAPRASLVLARVADPGLDEYEIEPRPGGVYHVDDRGKLVGDMELVDSAPGRRVYFISGYWKFVFGIRFNGRMVLVPTYAETAADAGPAVDASADGYMKIDNAVVGLVAKVVANVFPGKVDKRMARFARAVRAVAVMVRDDPAGAYGILAASGKVPDDELARYREVFLRHDDMFVGLVTDTAVSGEDR